MGEQESKSNSIVQLGKAKERRAQYSERVQKELPVELTIKTRLRPELRSQDMIFTKKMSLRYGLNPGWPAAFYAEDGASGPCMATMEVLHEGEKGLGYINVGDMDLGQRLTKKLKDTFSSDSICTIVKHEMPSGVARGQSSYEAFQKAWHADSLSNFGGVAVFSNTVNEKVAFYILDKKLYLEVMYAPLFANAVLDLLAKDKNAKRIRLVKMQDISQAVNDNGFEYKRVAGGLLVEKREYSRIVSPEYLDCVSDRKPTRDEMEAAVFLWNVAFMTRSNAVVIGTKDKTHGIGSGQKSRIDAAYDAIRFANGRECANPDAYGAQGTFMASDAFMPQTDVVELAAKHSITGIVYPLGSIKDQDVIDKANEHNMTLLITRKPGETHGGERGFLHR